MSSWDSPIADGTHYEGWGHRVSCYCLDNYFPLSILVESLENYGQSGYLRLGAFQTLEVYPAPFSASRRFPPHGIYINTTCGTIPDLYMKLEEEHNRLKTLRTEDTSREFKAMQPEDIITLRKHTKALLMFPRSDDLLHLASNGIFNREGFESYFKLSWVK